VNSLIFIQLLLAHILTDFIIQPDKWVEKKIAKGLRSGYFWLHIGLAGLLTYLILMQWINWIIPLFIVITHGLIDLWKIKKEQLSDISDKPEDSPDSKVPAPKYFFVDQLLHLLMIILAWLYLTDNFRHLFSNIADLLSDTGTLTIITAFLIVIWPAGKAIGKITEPLRKEFLTSESLSNAGNYIGILERILVLIFVLINQYSAIGFLIAAKSLLRVSREGDENGRKKTEYVLIGTLLSFSVAIVTGLIVKIIIN
jgi:hypothetical protein